MIESRNLLLREPFQEDYIFLKSLRNDLNTQKLLLTLPRTNDLEKVKKWVQSRLKDEHAVLFIIATKNNGNPIGYVQVINMHFVHRVAEIGICIEEKSQRKGYFKITMKLLEKYLLDIFNIDKLVAYILTSNIASVKAFEKTGYNKVGILKKQFYQDGKFNDVSMYEKIFSNKR